MFKSKTTLIFFLILTNLFFFSKCTKDRAALIKSTDTQNVCETLDIKYSTSIKPIINLSCAITNCHVSGGSAPTDYTTYSGLMTSVNFGNVFINRVFELKDMPPNGSPGLTSSDLQKLKCWIDNGAQNN